MIAALTLWAMTLALVLLPIAPALAEWYLRRDASALFVAHDATVDMGTMVKECLHLEANTRLLGSMHAARVHVSAGSRLHGAVTADISLNIDAPCHFTRLGAARMELGDMGNAAAPLMLIPEVHSHHEKKPVALHALPENLKHERRSDRTLIDGDFTLPDNSVFEGHLIVYRDLSIGTRACVIGSVKSYGRLMIGKAALIDGAAISGDTLNMAGGARVRGPVIAEAEIRLQRGCVLGTAQHQTSVSAPRILIEQGALVFGTLSAREHGELIA